MKNFIRSGTSVLIPHLAPNVRASVSGSSGCTQEVSQCSKELHVKAGFGACNGLVNAWIARIDRENLWTVSKKPENLRGVIEEQRDHDASPDPDGYDKAFLTAAASLEVLRRTGEKQGVYVNQGEINNDPHGLAEKNATNVRAREPDFLRKLACSIDLELTVLGLV